MRFEELPLGDTPEVRARGESRFRPGPHAGKVVRYLHGVGPRSEDRVQSDPEVDVATESMS